MKHALAAAISSAALLLATGALADGGPAPEPPPPPPMYEEPPPPAYRWYTTVFAGVAFGGDLNQDVDFIDDFDPDDDFFFTFEEPLKTGYLLGWTIGYQSLFDTDWFSLRPEIELSFRQRDVDFEEFILDFDEIDGFAGDDVFDNFSDPADVLSLLFNLWLDFDFNGVRPYLGGGVGVGWADMPTVAFFLPHFESTDFVWQVGGGFNFDINERVFVGVGYRWFNGDFEEDTRFFVASEFFDPPVIIPLEGVLTVDFEYEAHEVLFNLGVRF